MTIRSSLWYLSANLPDFLFALHHDKAFSEDAQADPMSQHSCNSKTMSVGTVVHYYKCR